MKLIDEEFEGILENEYVDIEKTLKKLELLNIKTQNENIEYELFRQALHANLLKDYELAIEKANQVLEISNNIKNEFLIVNSNLLLGFIYWNRKNFETCWGYYLTVLSYVKHPRVLNNMGVVYHIFGDVEEAYKYYRLAKLELVESTNLRLKAIVWSNLSECECEFNRFEDAEKSLRIALKINYKLNKENGTAYIYNSFGLIEMKKKNYEKAIEYFKRGEKYYKNEMLLVYYLDLLQNYSKALYEIADYEGAKLKIKESEKLRNLHNFGEKNEQEIELLAKIYEIEGNCKMANSMYKEYIKCVKNNKLYSDRIKVQNLKDKVKLFKTKQKINDLEVISKTDALTKIKNRYAFDHYFNRNSCNEYDKIAIVFIDVDYFKEYNDNYGHIKGDECLKSIVNKLSEKLNANKNQLFRYGGDEFVAILSSSTNVFEILEEVRKDIENLKIRNLNSQISNYVTCSFGVTILKNVICKNHKKILEFTDNALYKAKENGKNNVVIFEIENRTI